MKTTLRLALLLAALAGPVSLAGDLPPAPNFTLPLRGGDTLTLQNLRGRVVMINFWASWCGPCKQEMPLLDQVYHRFKDDGFTLLGINVEDEAASAEAVLKKIPVSFPILFDRDSKVSERYEIVGMPSSILIDRNGRIRYVHRGYKPGDENIYRDQIGALIGE